MTAAVPVRLEFPILSLNPGSRQRCVASGLLQRGTQRRVVEGPHAVDLRRRTHGGPCRAEQCPLDLPLPGLGPAPSGGLTTNSRRTGSCRWASYGPVTIRATMPPCALTKAGGQCCRRPLIAPRHSESSLFRRSRALPARTATDTARDTSRCPVHGSRRRRFVTPCLPPDSHGQTWGEVATRTVPGPGPALGTHRGP